MAVRKGRRRGGHSVAHANVLSCVTLQRNGVLRDVLVPFRAFRTDVVEVLGPSQVVRRSSCAVTAECEVLGVLPVRRLRIAAEEGQSLPLRGQSLAQFIASISGRA